MVYFSNEIWYPIKIIYTYIIKILKATDFNQTKTAELLGVERRVIGRKIVKYGIER